jgi:hypothetical protein
MSRAREVAIESPQRQRPTLRLSKPYCKATDKLRNDMTSFLRSASSPSTTSHCQTR